MINYTKLDSSIIFSTVWQEPLPTKIVWITMLALKDFEGKVCTSLPGLADIADVSIEECEAALAKFMAPDKYSRTKDNEGRRIKEINGGWLVLNHYKYRDEISLEQMKEKARARQQKYRNKAKRRQEDVYVKILETDGQAAADAWLDKQEAKP